MITRGMNVLTRKCGTLSSLSAAVALAVPSVALAHIERDSYWPDPAPDTSVTPAAGGEVPKSRSLASALKARRGDLRVVCQADSLRRARRSIRLARTTASKLRPTSERDRLSRR